MKSMLDEPVRQEVLNRINSLHAKSTAHWGKMNLFQMLGHCSRCDGMFLGEIKIKRVFLGKLIGKMVLRRLVRDDRPFRKNAPTSPVLKPNETTGDIELQKREWISRIEQYGNYQDAGFIHPFFGLMTKEQVGILAYKHADHHLRQFGA